MKRIKVVGLCLVAVFAFSAVAVASASAAEREHFQQCVKAAKEGKSYLGHYTSKECTEASKVETGGKYELEAVSSGAFTGKSKTTTLTVHGVAGKLEVVVCKKDVIEGSINSEYLASGTVKFEKCQANDSKAEPCESEGAGKETISHGWLFALGWLNAGGSEPGALALISGELDFTCGSEEVYVYNGALGSVKNAKKGITITFAAEGGEQEYQHVWKNLNSESELIEESRKLYTEVGEREVEATLEGVEETKGPGVS